MEDGYHGDSWQTGHTSARRPRSAPAGARQVAGASLRGVIAGLFRSVIFLPSPITPSNCEENTERIPQRAPPGTRPALPPPSRSSAAREARETLTAQEPEGDVTSRR